MIKDHKRIFFTFGVIILIVSIMCFPIKALTFKEKTNIILEAYPIEYGEELQYSFIHSVSKTPMIEVLRIEKDDAFHLKKVIYYDQGGAGMPEFTWGRETFEMEDGHFVLENFDRSFSRIALTIQKEYKNKIQYDGAEIDLCKLVEGRDATVVVEISKIPLYQYIWCSSEK